MKIIKNLKFAGLAALAALAVTLLFQTQITRADDQGRRDEHGQQAKVTFTKHVVNIPNQPGLVANMVGVGEGDAGDVLFTGEVLKQDPDPATSWLCTTSQDRDTPFPRSSLDRNQSPASARRACSSASSRTGG